MIYRCRFLKPKLSEWFEVEADSPGAAIQTLHSVKECGISYRHDLGDGSAEYITFALMEVDGQELVSRMYHQGIRRQGRRNYPTLQQLAQQLGFERDPASLLSEWEEEQTEWESACAMTTEDRRRVKRVA